MTAQGDSPTSPIDVLVAVTTNRRLSLGGRPSTSDGRLSARLGGVPEESVAPSPAGDLLLERTPTADGFRSGSLGSPSWSGRRLSERAMSGVPVHDLFLITNDPMLQSRVLKADSNRDGRLSRQDIIDALKSEASAKQKLKWGLIIGGALLVLCLLMLAANAGLTYAVVSMSKETHVQSSGVMTDKSGSHIVGTAQAAEVADLLFAYLTPAEAGAALLGLNEVLVTTEDGTVAAYRVLASNLVSGERLELVVVAPTAAASQLEGQPAAEYIKIVISEAGVYEVRGTSSSGEGGKEAAGGSRRRLLQQLSGGRLSGGIQGMLTSTTTGTCGVPGTTCSLPGAQVGCPAVPTCGNDGKLYSSPCEARLAGTSVMCVNCGDPCPAPGTYRPIGLPPNLAWDGHGFVRPSPPADPGSVEGADNQAGSPPLAPGSVSPPAPSRPSGWPANLVIDGPGFIRSPPPQASNPSDKVDTGGAGGTTGGGKNPAPPPPKPRPMASIKPKPRPSPPKPVARPKTPVKPKPNPKPKPKPKPKGKPTKAKPKLKPPVVPKKKTG